VRAGLAELRSAVSSLGALEVEPRGLRRRIEETVGAFRESCAIDVVTQLGPVADELDAAQAMVLLRCVQEGLTNVQRHADAAHVSVTLDRCEGDGRIELVVADDGTSKRDGQRDVASRNELRTTGGFGLRSLRERAEAIGGTAVFTCDESGARLAVTIPAQRS